MLLMTVLTYRQNSITIWLVIISYYNNYNYDNIHELLFKVCGHVLHESVFVNPKIITSVLAAFDHFWLHCLCVYFRNVPFHQL